VGIGYRRVDHLAPHDVAAPGQGRVSGDRLSQAPIGDLQHVGQGDVGEGVGALRRALAFQAGLWGLFEAPVLVDQLATPETIICRCEEVTLAELSANLRPWLAAAGSLKRVTRAGMGKCQGRYCSAVLVELAARASKARPVVTSGFFPQAPFSPTPVSVLAAPQQAPSGRASGAAPASSQRAAELH